MFGFLKKEVEKMLVGIYTRVSTREQAEGNYSLGEQEARLKAYCSARDWTVANVYSDAGFSGGNTDRPALQKMINDIQRKKIELVLVYKLDRLSRSQKDTLTLIEDVFIKNNIHFVSVNENFDTSTPFGLAMVGVLSVFSQLERSTIQQRMEMGRVARAKEGYFHGGGYIPIGYDYIDGELVINDYEAVQVRKIYELFLKGWPVSRIRKYMSNTYKTKYGNWYSDSSVKSCLTTPLYYGKITFKGETYDGRHEPLVSEELFNKVQARLKELDVHNPKKIGSRKSPFMPTQLLGGIIFCGNCGARYYTHHINGRKGTPTEKGWDYYSCYSRLKSNIKMVVDPNCKNKHWRVSVVNKMVTDEILKLQFEEGYLQQISESNKDVDNVENNRQVIEKRLEDISVQIDKIMDMYLLGVIPLDKIAERIASLTNERNGLENELFNLQEDIDNKKMPLAKAKDILKGAKDVLDSNDMDNKRMLVHSLIDRVELFDDKIKIYWAF